MENPILVVFYGRKTGLGAYTKHKIFSVQNKCEIKPYRTERSKTGNHWTDYWYLLPGKYFVTWKDISNSGKHYCGYGLLIVGSPFIQLKSGEIRLYKEVVDDRFLPYIIGITFDGQKENIICPMF
jgi:hypothetical protein